MARALEGRRARRDRGADAPQHGDVLRGDAHVDAVRCRAATIPAARSAGSRRSRRRARRRSTRSAGSSPRCRRRSRRSPGGNSTALQHTDAMRIFQAASMSSPSPSRISTKRATSIATRSASERRSTICRRPDGSSSPPEATPGICRSRAPSRDGSRASPRRSSSTSTDCQAAVDELRRRGVKMRRFPACDLPRLRHFREFLRPLR